MEFKISFTELSDIASAAAERSIEIAYLSEDAVSLHTTKGNPFCNINIDLEFTIFELEDNKIFVNWHGGWLSRRAFKMSMANNKKVRMKGDTLIINADFFLPKYLESFRVVSIDITEDYLSVILR